VLIGVTDPLGVDERIEDGVSKWVLPGDGEFFGADGVRSAESKPGSSINEDININIYFSCMKRVDPWTMERKIMSSRRSRVLV
jgi:hypothetical protein